MNIPAGVIIETENYVDVSGGDLVRNFIMLYNATTSILDVTIVNPAGQTRALKIIPGYNPIAGTKITQAGTTLTASQLWAIPEEEIG